MLTDRKKYMISSQKNIKNIIIFIKAFSIFLILSLLYIFLLKSNHSLAIPSFLVLSITSALIILPTNFALLKQNSLKKNITISTIIFVIISSIIYFFPFKIFGIFIHETGLLNFIVYTFKIVFWSFPLIGFKIFIEKYFCKTICKLNIFHIIFLLKDFIILLILIPILYNFYNLSGIIWSIPYAILISTFFDIIVLKLYTTKR